MFIDHNKVRSTEIKEEEWTRDEHLLLLEYFGLFNKKFHTIAKLLNRNTNDVILHYYMKKRREKYNKKKNGRISDGNLKIMIDLEWTEGEKRKFEKLFEFYGKNWKAYEDKFEGKNACDFNNYFRYLRSSHKSKNNANRCVNNTNKDETNDEMNDNKKCLSDVLNDNIGHGAGVEDERSSGVKTRRGRKRKVLSNSISNAVNGENKKIKRNKVEKENGNNHKENVHEEWTIDERQLFAIFYPYIGKNWNDLSQYITTKKPSDCRTYFKFYFKNLSLAEQKLEAAMKNVQRDTFSVPGSLKRLNDDDFLYGVSVLFKK